MLKYTAFFGQNLNSLLGAEVFFSPGLCELDTRALCMGDTAYLLLEFPTTHKPHFIRQTLYNLQQQGIVPLICLLIGYPVAYYIAHCKPTTQRLLQMLIMLPMCMSFLLRTLAWVALLDDTGIINNFIRTLDYFPTRVNTADVVNSESDIAKVIWGGQWRLPSKHEIEELLSSCTWEKTENGYWVKAKNGKDKIFFPYDISLNVISTQYLCASSYSKTK